MNWWPRWPCRTSGMLFRTWPAGCPPARRPSPPGAASGAELLCHPDPNYRGPGGLCEAPPGSSLVLPEELMSDDELDLTQLPDDELIQRTHDDLYDGLADEVVAEVNEFLRRGWTPYETLTKAL